MKGKLIILMGVALLFGGKASAQDSQPKRAEVSVDYSYVSFYPASSYGNRHSLNGGGGSFAYFWEDLFGVKADFQAYASNTTHFLIPPGIPNVPGGSYSVQGNLFTYLFGPVIQPRKTKFAPYGQVLVGAAHTDVYSNLYTAYGKVGAAPSSNGFSMAAGGGLDIRLNDTFYFRPAQFEYLLTNFNNRNLSGNRIQNNFRYLAGIAIRF
jgi:hypothetical protein